MPALPHRIPNALPVLLPLRPTDRKADRTRLLPTPKSGNEIAMERQSPQRLHPPTTSPASHRPHDVAAVASNAGLAAPTHTILYRQRRGYVDLQWTRAIAE